MRRSQVGGRLEAQEQHGPPVPPGRRTDEVRHGVAEAPGEVAPEGGEQQGPDLLVARGGHARLPLAGAHMA